MEAKLVSGHSKGHKEGHGKGKVMHMRIERGANGVSVHIRREPPKMSANQMRSGMMGMYEDEPPMLFTKHKALADHIKEHMGDVLGAGGAAAEAKAGGADQGQDQNEQDTDPMD